MGLLDTESMGAPPGSIIQFWQKELSHYCREIFIRISQAVNFLFLTTVHPLRQQHNYQGVERESLTPMSDRTRV